MQHDRECPPRQHLLLRHIERDRQHIFDRAATPAAGSETALAADHQEADALIVNRPLHRFDLPGVEQVAGDVVEDDAVVRGECERVAGHVVRLNQFDDSLAFVECFFQRLPLSLGVERIDHEHHAALSAHEDRTERNVILCDVVGC